MPAASAGSERSSTISPARATFPSTSLAVSFGRIGTRSRSTIRPASGFATISWSVAPVSRSPCRIAQFTGARPRYFGRSEPWRLYAPRRGSASSSAPSIRR